jgi:HlyD family secretion protein
MSNRRRALWAAGVLAVVLVGWLMARDPGASVDVALVEQAPLEVLVREAGETRAVNQTVVSAPASGWLQPRVREEGVAVEAGDVLAELAPLALDARTRAEADARLARADAAWAAAAARARSADSTRAEAARDAQRAMTLARAGALSVREADAAVLVHSAAEDALHVAEAGVRDAEAERRAAREATREWGRPVVVRAPVSGRVLQVHERDRRAAPAGAPLLTLGDVQALDVRLEVLSGDALRVAPGQEMRLDFGAGLEAVAGEVVRVEPGGFAKRSPLGVEERRVRVVGRPRAPVQGVGDGYRVQATIVVWSGEAVLQAPASAFVRDVAGWAVYVVEGGRIRRRSVTPGERGAQAWVVEAGLRAGDTVVRFPDAGITEGGRARVAR